MSFYEYEDAFIWRCDKCRLEAIFPPGNFWSALAELKARGWRIERADDWRHECPRCKAKSDATILDEPLGRQKIVR